jgi:hypothetical protein
MFADIRQNASSSPCVSCKKAISGVRLVLVKKTGKPSKNFADPAVCPSTMERGAGDGTV